MKNLIFSLPLNSAMRSLFLEMQKTSSLSKNNNRHPFLSLLSDCNMSCFLSMDRLVALWLVAN